jgi:hypothetical protein
MKKDALTGVFFVWEGGNPFLIFIEHQEVPRSAERGQGRCPWTSPPLKRWAKLSNALRAAKGVQAFSEADGVVRAELCGVEGHEPAG